MRRRAIAAATPGELQSIVERLTTLRIQARIWANADLEQMAGEIEQAALRRLAALRRSGPR